MFDDALISQTENRREIINEARYFTVSFDLENDITLKKTQKINLNFFFWAYQKLTTD